MIYVSTSCYKEPKDLYKVLEIYKKLGITSIELGSMHSYISDFRPLFSYKKENNADFIIHCYFPPKKRAFLLNPASQDRKVLDDTIRVAKDAIELSRKLDSPHYGLHGGFWTDDGKDSSLRERQIGNIRQLSTALCTIGMLCDYAGEYGIRIAIENTPLDIRSCMFNEPGHFRALFRETGRKNLGVLLDVGHIIRGNIRSGASVEGMISTVKSRIIELHVHGIDKYGEDHLLLDDRGILKRIGLGKAIRKKAVTLEINNADEKGILSSLDTLKEAIGIL